MLPGGPPAGRFYAPLAPVAVRRDGILSFAQEHRISLLITHLSPTDHTLDPVYLIWPHAPPNGRALLYRAGRHRASLHVSLLCCRALSSAFELSAVRLVSSAPRFAALHFSSSLYRARGTVPYHYKRKDRRPAPRCRSSKSSVPLSARLSCQPSRQSCRRAAEGRCSETSSALTPPHSLLRSSAHSSTPRLGELCCTS